MEQHIVSRNAKALWGIGQESLKNRVDFPAEDTFVWPGETGVRQVGGPAGKYLVVRRLHVCVGADNGAYLSVQHASERNFFRGRFGVEIHEDDAGMLAELRHLFAPGEERIFQGRHKGPALDI